ncbi:unnamed protein product [Rhizopus stolonifer]
MSIFHRIDKRISLGAAVFLVAYWFLSKEKKEKQGIPTPKGAYFYFGHLPLIGSSPSAKVKEWHDQLGPIFGIKMGVQRWVFVSDPEMAHDLFVTRGASTSSRPYFTFGNGVHAPDNRGIVFADYSRSWKNARSAVLNILSPKSVDSLRPTLELETERGVGLMMACDEILPLEYTRLIALNIALATIFGLEGADSIEAKVYREVIGNLEETGQFSSATSDIRSFLPAFAFLDVIFRSKAKMQRFVEQKSRPLYRRLIALARENDQPSLIQKLDEIKKSLEIDEQNILSLSNELVVASVDTISLETAWTMAILCKYPEYQKKVMDDIDEFRETNGRLPTFDERDQVAYLTAFIKECFRFRSSAHVGLPHRVSEDIVYKNYIIPKETILFNNGHVSNHDSQHFQNPEKFIPERYMGDTRSLYASSNGNIQSRELFSFGWGRRICPGIYLVEKKIYLQYND